MVIIDVPGTTFNWKTMFPCFHIDIPNQTDTELLRPDICHRSRDLSYLEALCRFVIEADICHSLHIPRYAVAYLVILEAGETKYLVLLQAGDKKSIRCHVRILTIYRATMQMNVMSKLHVARVSMTVKKKCKIVSGLRSHSKSGLRSHSETKIVEHLWPVGVFQSFSFLLAVILRTVSEADVPNYFKHCPRRLQLDP